MCRDKFGATAREQKQAVTVLTEAAGLVSSKQHTSQKLVPVPGFPDYAFASGGQPAALRELGKSYQVIEI